MHYHYFGHLALALIRREGKLLLVQHKGRNGKGPSWWLPGGKVERGEDLFTALEREVREEIGLQLHGTPRLAFLAQVIRKGHAEIEESMSFHFACEVKGEFSFEDPDELVIFADWLPEAEALQHLSTLFWYDVEPLRRWLSGEATEGTIYTIEAELLP